MKDRPTQIERGSMDIIRAELAARGITPGPEEAPLVLRCIHASADFDYAENLRFTPGAVGKALEALKGGAHIVTDTNMALAGVSKPGLKTLGGEAHCFMAEPEIAQIAKARNCTRAVASMDFAAAHLPEAIYAVGNAPTALFALAEHLEGGMRPALIVAVPVGFVNVVEAKEQLLTSGLPCIVSRGRRGGSTVASAIVNALMYGIPGVRS